MKAKEIKKNYKYFFLLKLDLAWKGFFPNITFI